MTFEQNVYWSDAYVVRGGFDTVSKSAAVVAALKEHPVPGATITSPWIHEDLLTSLYRIRSRSYVHSVLQGADGEQGPEALTSVLDSTAGMLSAAEDVVVGGAMRAGSLSSGMHHAGRTYGAGFCTFNGVALAAHRLAKAYDRVLVIDTDAHAGGGTFDIVRRIPNVGQVDLIASPYDDYDTRSKRFHKCIVSKAKNYLPSMHDLFADWVSDNGVPDAIVYNAGMDPHQGCGVGGKRGITTAMLAAREHEVFDFAQDCHAPVVWGLAGGYVGTRLSLRTLAQLHRSTIEAAAVER